jgi:hypothetical protein
VLRYGLPVSLFSATLEVRPGGESFTRRALDNLYANLSASSAVGAQHKNDVDVVDYSGIAADFYSYVYLKIAIL